MASADPHDPGSPADQEGDYEELRACFDACLDSSSYGVLVLGQKGRVLALNRHLTALFGLPQAPQLGEDGRKVLDQIAVRFENPRGFHDRVRHARSGARQPDPGPELSLESWLDEALPLAENPARRISIACTPIRRGQRELGEAWSFEDASEVSRDDALLQTLGEASATAYVITRVTDATILYANAEMARLLGTTAEALIGTRSVDFYDNPGDRQTYVEKLLTDGSVRSHEVRMRRADGSTFWSLLSMNRLELGGETVAIGSLYDITARKQAEQEQQAALKQLKEAQAMLITSEKMAALGALVAGIAHEINTPVGAMLSMHDTLVRAVQRLEPTIRKHGDARAQALLHTVEECNRVIATGAQRVALIVRRLKSFARLDAAELHDFDVEAGLDDTVALLHHQLKHRIKVERDYAGVPNLRCYAGRLNQVFLNLLVNGYQAIETTGTLRIATRYDARQVRIRICDDGCGIPPENLPKLFDPGFTTKGVGVGTGLGLSICYQIVQEHHGEIRVESEVGKGSCFEVILPR